MHHAKLTGHRTTIGLVLCGAIMLAGAIDRDTSFTIVGVLLVLAGMLSHACELIVREVRTVNRPADDAFTEGYESGYDRGWRDGNAEARPRLVAVLGPDSGRDIADTCDVATQRRAGRASNQ
jgi:hypothetical protein